MQDKGHSFEFKRDLHKLQNDLSLIKEGKAGLEQELEPEKAQIIELLISLAGMAIRGELSGREWQNTAVPQIRSLGRVTIDQKNQRVNQQVNIGNLYLTIPVPPTPPDPEILHDFETKFRQRIKCRYGRDASYYVELVGETTEVVEVPEDTHASRSAIRRRRRMNPQYCELIQQGREIVRVKLKTLREAAEIYPCVILLGDPGCGKTTALQHLAYEMADVSERLPVPLRLSKFEPGMAVEEFIVQGWAGAEDAGYWNAPELADNLESYLRAGKLFILLDALNEMPQEGYADRTMALRGFINKWSRKDNRFLVTCRVLDYRKDLYDLQRVEIQPLGDGQIVDFLERELPSNWETLWGELTRDSDDKRSLLKVARNPFMLTVMIDVYDQNGHLGRNRAELMTQFVDYLMDRAKEICPTKDWLSAEVQRRALAVMAFEIQDREVFGTEVETAKAKAVMPEQVQQDPN